DCVFIRAGTVHALGEGIVIAEIQQASNTTFRLFDWNRIDKDGKSRPLHIAESLEVTDYARGAVEPQVPQAINEAGIERLVECDKFVLDRATRSAPLTLDLKNRFHLIATLEGEIQIDCVGTTTILSKGQ